MASKEELNSYPILVTLFSYVIAATTRGPGFLTILLLVVRIDPFFATI
jgi:hypothetical protein